MNARPVYDENIAGEPAGEELIGDRTTSVLVVGAGFTGLSTALHLLDRQADVTVLDTHEAGWGASGRNGGQVNPGLKYGPADVEKAFGKERGARLIELASGAPSYTFDLIKRYGIQCEAQQTGTFRVGTSTKSKGYFDSVAADWQRYGVNLGVFDGRDLAPMIGTPHYCAAILDPRGGNLNPLAYIRGLSQAVRSACGKIYNRSPVLALSSVNGKWKATTPRGTITADKVVIATNGYSDSLLPQVRDSVIPIYSAIAATAPLPPHIAKSILPGRQSLYEDSKIGILYFRVDQAGRLLMGGPSVLHDTSTRQDFQHLIDKTVALFPALKDAAWTHFWNGQVALTKDRYPHLHELAPGLTAAFGYSGRGVAMATVMGRVLANRLCDTPEANFDFPITQPQTFAFRRFWKPGVWLRLQWGDLISRVPGN